MSPPNTGLRRKTEIDGLHCYVTVSDGPDGPAVDVTWDDEVPMYSRPRSIVDGLCGLINEMFGRMRHDA